MSRDWYPANRLYMEAALGRVRTLLQNAVRREGTPAAPASELTASECTVPELPDPDSQQFGGGFESFSPALIELARRFSLSAFERDLVLLAAGAELDPGFAPLCAAAQGDPERCYPTFALALEVLPEPSWQTLAPAASLRRWHLLEVTPGPTLLASPLRLEEPVLHYLWGFDGLDERLAALAAPLPAPPALVPSHRRLAEILARTWASGQAPVPAALLVARESASARAVAAAAAAALGLGVMRLPAESLPTAPGELHRLARLLTRDAALGRWALLVDGTGGAAAEAEAGVGSGSGARGDAVANLAEQFHGPLLVAVPERRALGRRRLLTLEVARPEPGEQRELWRSALGEAAGRLDGFVDRLTAQFDLDTEALLAAGAQALGEVAEEAGTAELSQALWRACRAHARPRIESLAQRIRPAAGWDDLVLPPAEKSLLGEIVLHARQRSRVHGEWGFAARSSRGLGMAALFAGPSGTGKTMAAEVLARELDLDLYRIDLAAVVSKYIGETEKNLKAVFDAAESGGAILLFDEADALFGKRSEVKDSHDRYANIEVGYLLQRMEAYRGLAILTSNLKDALDPAFLRRLRFVVRFPFPDEALRREIWRRVFPRETPVDGLDFERLARLGLTGGHIHNVALGAAFLAAADSVPVTMRHLLQAARSEYAKLEKPFTEKGMEVAS